MEETSNGKESLDKIFLVELVKAASWGTIILVVIAVLLLGAKQNIKEAIDFTLKRAVGEVYYFVSNPVVKQDIKEALEFMSEQPSKEVKKLLADPAFKQDVKEAIDLWHSDKANPSGKLSETK